MSALPITQALIKAEAERDRAVADLKAIRDSKLDGWYWCTTDAEFVSAARRCPTADPTLCRLVAIYVAGGSDTTGETP